MPNTNTIFTEEHNIQTPCKLFVVGDPQVLLIQPSARHEEKNDGVRREVDLIAQASPTGFAMVFFDCVEWARALMPWADDAVSRDAEVGRHAPDTLRFIEHTLLPWLRERFGALPCIIGGYSLGGLFALWAARNTDAFAAVAPLHLRSGLTVGANMQLHTPYSHPKQQLNIQHSTFHILNRAPAQFTSPSATARNTVAISA